LRFFTEHRQRDWLEWLAIAEFSVNNKVHSATKVLLFMANYGRELQMGTNIKRKGKVEKAMEFVERMRKIQEEIGTTLRKAQEEMKRQVDRKRQEVEEWRKREKVILSTKDLVFKERLTKEVDREVCGTIYNRRSSIKKCSEIETTDFNEDSSSG